ncbi:MAG: TetR/AcrR family transcriptional regulator, partial [Actinomycetia bacterium]|nr:TetR/AcrR family transcriptional regulator [Actinomycetes bacterium]
RVLSAAADHFARLGYRRTNISDIADEAGIGKGTVYQYFDSKIELLVACVALEKFDLIPRLEEVMEREPAKQLEAYLQIAIRFAITAPLSSALIKGDRELSAALADATEEGLLADPAQSVAFLGGLVSGAAPGVSEEQRDRLAQTLLIASTFHAPLSTMQQLMDLTNEDFITTYARVLARGVASQSPSKAEPA